MDNKLLHPLLERAIDKGIERDENDEVSWSCISGGCRPCAYIVVENARDILDESYDLREMGDDKLASFIENRAMLIDDER